MLLTVVLLFLTLNCYAQASTKLLDDGKSESFSNYEVNISLMKNSILYGILSESAINDYKINGFCSRDLRSMFNGINDKQMWAIKGKLKLLIE